jgi:predicted SPOUT superfamily RNA methylase MTH1
MAKLLNICMILGSLELFVIVNEKQQKEGATDINLQAYARVNPKKVIEQLLRVKTSSSNQGQMLSEAASQEPEIYGYIVSQVQAMHFLLEGKGCKGDVVFLYTGH